ISASSVRLAARRAITTALPGSNPAQRAPTIPTPIVRPTIPTLPICRKPANRVGGHNGLFGFLFLQVGGAPRGGGPLSFTAQPIYLFGGVLKGKLYLLLLTL